MEDGFQGRAVLVFGASGALGSGVATAFAAAGATVTGADKVLPAAGSVPGTIRYESVNVLDDAALRALFDAHPSPWAVVNTVGGFAPRRLEIDTGPDGVTRLEQAGWVTLPAPVSRRLALWWLDQYGGGLFLPVRDATAGSGSYGGGRYLLDTAKGADLGSVGQALIIDLNFLYHPSCRYDDRWVCPLAPGDNTIDVPIPAGERLH